MEVDKFGNARLIDRNTGKPHVCCAASAREILQVASLADDGAPRYVCEADYDGLSIADSKAAKVAADKAAAAVAKEKAEAEAAEAKARLDAAVDAEIARRKKAGAL
jgi:hypothetical protein